jgi:diacylglycerol O-acyltransferase
MTATRMSRVDTAWLRMDSDVNLMMIVGVWLLQPAVTLEALRACIGERLLRFDRFGQRVRQDALGAQWVDDEHFDLARHVVPARLVRRRGQGERDALKALCGELASTPLDARHPLWQFHLVEHYEGGSALVARLHHCIADGISLISVMMGITDGGAAPPERPRRPQRAPTQDRRDTPASASTAAAGAVDWLADLLIRPIGELSTQAIGLAGGGASRSLDVLAQPGGALGATADLARAGAQLVSDAASILLMPDDSATRLKGALSGRKAVAWGEPISLADVKTIGKGLNCSVNDVLLACVAGAVGEYLRAHGDDPAGQEIRAMVPVNLRPMEQAHELGNRFGLAPLVLPVGIVNPIERVYEVRRRMAALKGSYQPLLAFGVLALAGVLVKGAQDALLETFSRKATAVMTNVPGPAEPLRLCGSTLRQTMFWVPASGNIGLGVSILSYAGGVQFGIVADTARCPDPQALIAQFEPQFEALLLATLMLPWAGQDGGP